MIESPAAPADDALAILKPLLSAQIDGHRELLGLLEAKRDAIRKADIDAITRLCHEERAVARRIEQIERLRLERMRALDGGAPAPTLSSLIARLAPAEARRDLTKLADELRSLVERVRALSAVVTSAAQSLARHLAGVRQAVERTVAGAGLYERRGRHAFGEQREFCVDVRS